MVSKEYSAGQIWPLPPLILHPFSDVHSPEKLVQSSRAGLILQGLLPRNNHSIERLEEILLDGRYCEIRMLYYLGKDTVRWIDQCMEIVGRESKLRAAGIDWQSFAVMLAEDPPASVVEKLKTWGVADHRSIFTRGIALNSIFAEVPARDSLVGGFIRNYHQYADQIFQCRMSASSFARIRSQDFEFQLFASGEYAKILENEWREA
ncbi:MAG TPA: hypothetical protein VEQ63_16060 [Bryobacteraceae bacterium]|nr:hypothetical protein [Bryobacteraceae bacterium]